MYKYEVGQCIENFKNHEEGVQFDISDDGATMLVFLKLQHRMKLNNLNQGKNLKFVS